MRLALTAAALALLLGALVLALTARWPAPIPPPRFAEHWEPATPTFPTDPWSLPLVATETEFTEDARRFGPFTVYLRGYASGRIEYAQIELPGALERVRAPEPCGRGPDPHQTDSELTLRRDPDTGDSVFVCRTRWDDGRDTLAASALHLVRTALPPPAPRVAPSRYRAYWLAALLATLAGALCLLRAARGPRVAGPRWRAATLAADGTLHFDDGTPPHRTRTTLAAGPVLVRRRALTAASTRAAYRDTEPTVNAADLRPAGDTPRARALRLELACAAVLLPLAANAALLVLWLRVRGG